MRPISAFSRTMNPVSPRLSRVLVPWLLKNSRYLSNVPSLIKAFRDCRLKRNELLSKEDLMVPPVMILSVTNNCNLQCRGCFVEKLSKRSMSLSDWQNMIRQAKQLGVFAFLIAGGEPFLMEGLLDLIDQNEDRVFAIFTNGTCIDEEQIEHLKKTSNVAIVLSLEGDEQLTDERRGKGIYEKVIATLKKLSQFGILSGISVTITTDNYSFWMKDENMNDMIKFGVKLCFFIEYIDVDDSEKILNIKQRTAFREKVLYYKDHNPIFIVHSPGDETMFGGCVSAGRGFIHVNAFGDITPCPVVNVSTHNVKNSTLKEGLKSPLFQQIRENKLLENGDGPCALISHRKELDALVQVHSQQLR